MNAKNTWARAHKILEAATNSTEKRDVHNRIEEVTLHGEGYAERGYTDPEHGIIALGNWNSISHYDKEKGEFIDDDNTLPRIAELFGKLGIECDWDDEWGKCHGCGKLFRTQGDSYGWQACYYECNGERLCLECVDPEEVLEDLEGEAHKALTIDTINPTEHGYVKANEDDYENGWYGGQNDDPTAIAKDMEAHGISRFLFRVDSVGQFDLRFSVFVHEDEAHLLSGTPQGKCEDPAIALKRGLQGASDGMSKLQGKGIKYSKIHSDGTATTRLVSPEEFVAGIRE